MNEGKTLKQRQDLAKEKQKQKLEQLKQRQDERLKDRMHKREAELKAHQEQGCDLAKNYTRNERPYALEPFNAISGFGFRGIKRNADLKLITSRATFHSGLKFQDGALQDSTEQYLYKLREHSKSEGSLYFFNNALDTTKLPPEGKMPLAITRVAYKPKFIAEPLLPKCDNATNLMRRRAKNQHSSPCHYYIP